MDFEHFLQDKHAEDYHGTDDDMPDAFEGWLENQQVDDLMQYADQFAGKMILETKEKMLKSFQPMVELLEEIKEAVVPPTPHDL